MELTLRTNRLAIVSLVTGLIGLVTLGITSYPVLFPGSPGSFPDSTSLMGIMDVSRSLRDLCTILSLLTGILALREIRKKGGTEKGKGFAWVGVIIGAGWILVRVVVAIFFILALLFAGL